MIEIETDPDGFRRLVATERIAQGAIICPLPSDGTLTQPNRYSIEVGPGVHLDCALSPVGAMNHSCRPNASIWWRRWAVVAWRCIEPGDELTIDYRKTETKLAEPFTCGDCGREIA